MLWLLTSALVAASRRSSVSSFLSFFFNDTATTEIYTLSLHDALPISFERRDRAFDRGFQCRNLAVFDQLRLLQSQLIKDRSEEHTSELQSRQYLVCRLLLEKKKKKTVRLVALNK